MTLATEFAVDEQATESNPEPPSNLMGDSKSRIRVLVVDDHKAVRHGLIRMLQSHEDIWVVGEAADGNVATILAREMRPDVILMDFSMPGISGLQATRIIHAELPDTRIIGLSMFGDFEYAEAMFIAGAAAYIAKGCPPETVLNAIRACRPDCRKWAETPPAPLKSSST